MLVSSLVIALLNLTSFWRLAGTSPVCPQCYQQSCDDKKNCLNGCNPGFAGRTCSNKCQPNCLESSCDFDGKTGTYPCSIGCIPGFHGLQCNSHCESIDKDGKCDRFSGTAPDCRGINYGENCETSCKSKCVGAVCDNKGQCYKHVCIPGRYGADCNRQCHADCKLCHRDTGKCLPTYDLDLQKPSWDCSGTVQRKDYTGFYIAFTILLIFIAVVVTVYHYKKWKTSQESRLGEYRKLSKSPDWENNKKTDDVMATSILITVSQPEEERKRHLSDGGSSPSHSRKLQATLPQETKRLLEDEEKSNTRKKNLSIPGRRGLKELRQRKSRSNPDLCTLQDEHEIST